MNHETLKRIRAEAEAYAKTQADAVLADVYSSSSESGMRASTRLALYDAFLRGADSAATAMLAEKRER